MKICLVDPPYAKLYGFRSIGASVLPSLGLTYIAAYLEEQLEGVQVHIIDTNVNNMTTKETSEILLKHHPDIIGVTVNTQTLKGTLEIVKRVKEADNEIITILGGIHPSALPRETAQHPGVDLVVKKEGEITMKEIVETMMEGREPHNIIGTTFKKDDKIIDMPNRPYIRNLDSLPFPARHLLQMDLYQPSVHRDFARPFDMMITSRGCPFRCIYCGTTAVFGHTCRFRSVQNILLEMEELVEKRHVREIMLWDDVLTLNRKPTMALFREVINRGLDLCFVINTRPDTVDKELLRLMKKAGVKIVFYGVEDGNQPILNWLKRDMTLNQIRCAFRITSEEGIFTVASIMFGKPCDTKESIARTLKFVEELEPDFLHAGIFTIYPGTEAYRLMLETGKIEHEMDWLDHERHAGYPWGHPVISCFDRETLQRLWKEIYAWFYLNPQWIHSQLKKVENFMDVERVRRSIEMGLATGVEPKLVRDMLRETKCKEED